MQNALLETPSQKELRQLKAEVILPLKQERDQRGLSETKCSSEARNYSNRASGRIFYHTFNKQQNRNSLFACRLRSVDEAWLRFLAARTDRRR